MKIKTFNLGILQANAYLIWDSATKQAIIFDCGGEASKVFALLVEKKLTLKYIILTHGHADHIAGVPELKAQTGATVIAHQEALDLLADADKNMSNMIGGKPIVLKPDETVVANQQGTYAGFELYFYHTPGHTPGSICIQVGENLFTGDTLFKGSIGRTDLYGGSMQTLNKSLNQLKKLSHRLRVYPGHGELTTLRDEVAHNPFLR